MLSLVTITVSKVPAAVLAAQEVVDHAQMLIQCEAAKVAVVLAGMNFADYAVDGPMLTGAWDGDLE